ncbi:unnamed protein product [Brugia pahangi]|uniref:Uncharacterized protein n=1 Tax=Brugia pahangi TaxID=6280 RepID=A0A0N4T4R3_BRUPA|nr:unnamed protein product [Brugia pahangi]
MRRKKREEMHQCLELLFRGLTHFGDTIEGFTHSGDTIDGFTHSGDTIEGFTNSGDTIEAMSHTNLFPPFTHKTNLVNNLVFSSIRNSSI